MLSRKPLSHMSGSCCLGSPINNRGGNNLSPHARPRVRYGVHDCYRQSVFEQHIDGMDDSCSMMGWGGSQGSKGDRVCCLANRPGPCAALPSGICICTASFHSAGRCHPQSLLENVCCPSGGLNQPSTSQAAPCHSPHSAPGIQPRMVRTMFSSTAELQPSVHGEQGHSGRW